MQNKRETVGVDFIQSLSVNVMLLHILCLFRPDLFKMFDMKPRVSTMWIDTVRTAV